MPRFTYLRLIDKRGWLESLLIRQRQLSDLSFSKNNTYVIYKVLGTSNCSGSMQGPIIYNMTVQFMLYSSRSPLVTLNLNVQTFPAMVTFRSHYSTLYGLASSRLGEDDEQKMTNNNFSRQQRLF